MDAKEVKVQCPCCESRLDVDLLTGRVVRWRRKGEKDETGKPVLGEADWRSASEHVEKRMDTAAERFDASLSREKNRGKDLDDLFRKASDKAKRKDDGQEA